MHPILFQLGPLTVMTHDAFTVLALAVGLAIYYRELRRRGWLGGPIIWISLAAVLGGAIGARVITSWEHLEVYGAIADQPFSEVIEHSGKSILGAIAGGYIAIVLSKRAFGYTRSTGDCYLLAIPVATVIGRIGCFFSELPLGTPTDLPWGISVSPAAAAAFARCPGCDVPMHPSMVYEILFNLVAIAVILRYRDRVVVPGDAVKLYLLAAGIFRFLVEFVRGNEPQALGLTGPQWVLIPMVALLVLHFARQVRRDAYRIPAPPTPIPVADGGTHMTDDATPEGAQGQPAPGRRRSAADLAWRAMAAGDPRRAAGHVDATDPVALHRRGPRTIGDRRRVHGRGGARGPRAGRRPPAKRRSDGPGADRRPSGSSWVPTASCGSCSRSRTCSARRSMDSARSPRGSSRSR